MPWHIKNNFKHLNFKILNVIVIIYFPPFVVVIFPPSPLPLDIVVVSALGHSDQLQGNLSSSFFIYVCLVL